MRTLGELTSLVAEAGSLWRWFFLQMAFWFCAGSAAQIVGNLTSVWLGARFNVPATIVFVSGLIAMVTALILMIHSCEPGLRSLTAGRDVVLVATPVPRQVFTSEPRLDVLAMTVGPFLAVYALWGLVEDEVEWLFVINIALTGLGGVDSWSVSLQWVTFYVVMAVVAYALRLVVAAVSRRTGWVWLLVPAVLLEGLWVVSSFLAFFAVGRRIVTWLEGRAIYQGITGLWYRFLGWLPEITLPFDLTLPEAVAALVDWVWSTLLPGVGTAVLLPLVWLALTATVFGWRTFTGADVISGTPLDASARRWQARMSVRAAAPAWLLALRTGRLLSSDLRTKYLPVLSALRLVLRAGPRFLGAFLVLATAIETLERVLLLAIDHLVGPQDPVDYLARSGFTDLAVELLTTSLAVALYVAAFDRVVAVSVGTRSSLPRTPARAEAAPGPPRRPAPGTPDPPGSAAGA